MVTLIQIVFIAAMIIVVASITAALTSTPKDDKIIAKFIPIGKLYKVIDWCALNIGKAKQIAKKK
jgi:hypothetical protein